MQKTSSKHLKTAVLFLVFNRLNTTKQVFEAIRNAKPDRLYVAADGPRDSRTGEATNVKAVRDYIVEHIDWDCEFKTLFRENNLGCKYAVSSGIDWFFENEEMGIILEDDCLPSKSFFQFCEELLTKYHNDNRVMHISGTNLLSKEYSIKASYIISQYGGIWGWATWKRAWKHYDVVMTKWEDKRRDVQWLHSVCETKNEQNFLIKNFDLVYNNGLDTWDFQWFFSRLLCNGFSIVPKVNLIENIGFGNEATHTKQIRHELDFGSCRELEFPLSHLNEIKRDSTYDMMYSKQFFKSDTWLSSHIKHIISIEHKIKSMFR